MSQPKTKKEQIAEYKGRKKTGGLYAIRNTRNSRILLGAAADLRGMENRFEFSRKTHSCVDMKLQKDWAEQNGEGFEFEVLESLEQGETQTDAEFQADLRLLREIWLEKLAGEPMY